MKTILITGASGLIGTHLTTLLLQQGYRVIHLSRSVPAKNEIETFVWNVKNKTIDDNAVKQADHIVHLAGAGIADKKWTPERKQEIIDSRTDSTQLLFESILRCNKRLDSFVSASAIGFYGAVSRDKTFTEEDPAENDFMGTCCRLWEQSTEKIGELGIRTVKIRVGIVLSKKGGALAEMAKPVRLGIGSALGTGKQITPWIHIDDICAMFLKAITDPGMLGTYNGVAPEPVSNKELMRLTARILHRPFFFPNVPVLPLKMIFGEMTAMFLEGSRVSSGKIERTGFEFKFRKAEDALRDLLA